MRSSSLRLQLLSANLSSCGFLRSTCLPSGCKRKRNSTYSPTILLSSCFVELHSSRFLISASIGYLNIVSTSIHVTLHRQLIPCTCMACSIATSGPALSHENAPIPLRRARPSMPHAIGLQCMRMRLSPPERRLLLYAQDLKRLQHLRRQYSFE